jgi:glycosyltransferase involved in cell wall biosynthesis
VSATPPAVVVFCPQNPIPPSSGYHHRMLSVIDAVVAAGASVTVAGTEAARPRWTDDAARALVDRGVERVEVHRPNRVGRLVRRAARSLADRPARQGMRRPEMALLRWWLWRLALRRRADVVIGSYALWQRALPTRLRRHVTVLDAIDVVSLNRAMWERLEPLLPAPGDPVDAAAPAIDEHLFDGLALAADPEELAAFDRCDVTIAISEPEAAAIAAGTNRTRVVTVPMSLPVVDLQNSWDGPAVFTTGPNPFNVQGVLWFVARVLPAVLAGAPDFRLVVTGHAGRWVDDVAGVEAVPFVDDLSSLYASARLSIAPLLGCTGQQVKVVESLAHGVPVVATEVAAAASPIVDGATGLVARSPQDFAAAVVALWNDAPLRAAMGAAARARARSDGAATAMEAELARLLRRDPAPPSRA